MSQQPALTPAHQVLPTCHCATRECKRYSREGVVAAAEARLVEHGLVGLGLGVGLVVRVGVEGWKEGRAVVEDGLVGLGLMVVVVVVVHGVGVLEVAVVGVGLGD